MKLNKAQRTRKKIIDTFYNLNSNETKRLSTVNEICEACDITRSTFYTHFSGVDEIINLESKAMKEEWLKIRKSMNVPEASSKESFEMTYNKMMTIVKFSQDKRKECILLTRPDLNLPYRSFFTKFIKQDVMAALKKYDLDKQDYIAGYIVNGIMYAMTKWMQKQDMTCDEFVDLIFKLADSSLHV